MSTDTATGSATEDRTSSQEEQPLQCCTSFTCFPKLPIELRLKIWKEAAFVTRNICLSVKHLNVSNDTDDEDTDNGGSVLFEPFVYLVACPHPPILHTSHESRLEGLKHYSLEFGVEQKRSRPSFTFSSPATIYVNWKADRICITDPRMFRSERARYFCDFIGRCRERGVRYIAFNAQDLCEWFSVDDHPLLRAISDGSMPLMEIILFSADTWIIKQEVIKKNRATLNLRIMSARAFERAAANEGFFSNRGDIEWECAGCLQDLEVTEDALTEGFVQYEEKLAVSEGDKGNATVSSWTRPKVGWCIAKLKLLPGQIAEVEVHGE